jgi:metallo-beta-lactamase class B
MPRLSFTVAVVLVVIMRFAISPARAQDTQSVASNSPQVEQHLSLARQIAGAEWQTTADFLCGPSPNPGNAAETPILEPKKIFDNLYAFGRSGAVVYALTTDDGIILIDSGYPDQVETVLLPGMRELGLNPADIKYVIVAHAHRDHYGGSRFLQSAYEARIVLSAADWDFMDQYRSDTEGAANGQPPERDQLAVEGEGIVLGDVAVTPVLVPGHTPGSLGLIFPVQDGSQTHLAGLFGGTILVSSRISDEGLQQYIESIEHFSAIAYEMGVNVEIQNHPVIDDMSVKLPMLDDRAPTDPHPFVVGTDAYQRFLGVIAECARVEVARRIAR